MSELQQQINELIANDNKYMPKAVIKGLKGTLIKDSLSTTPLQVGDKLPDGLFLNHKGGTNQLSKLRKDEKAVIMFYRGEWCPYCNLTLNYYNKVLASLDESVNFYAISPEQPDVTMNSFDIEQLSFTVLSDPNNEFASKMGLVYKLSKVSGAVVKRKGGNLEASQGNNEKALPIPATFVVNGEGVITHTWVEHDFTIRAEPEEVLAAYRSIDLI